MPADTLQLHVAEFTDRDHWHWRLTDADGRFLADHHVELDPSEAEYRGFIDLERYVERYASPDKWPDEEVRLIEQVGAWIGRKVLGPIAARIVDYGTPVTVRVILPPEASGLLYRPLELAHARGEPLALQDVSLVLEVDEDPAAVRWQPVGNVLRMLAVFSQPTDASALALRRERYELKRLISRIVQTYGVAVELRVLQYGVTRDILRGTLEEGEGWDVVHFSGHGLATNLLLEKSDGTADVITAEHLESLLHPARGRLKLVTLSACLSAASTIEETLRWLGLSPASMKPADTYGSPEEVPPATARALVRNLDCAVLAMRYPVGDDFAIGLCAEIYEGLLGKRQRLTRATQLAIPDALGDGPHPGVPPLSVATPALFGQRAADLELEPPLSAATEYTVPPTSLAYFPNEAERFVGRVGPMARTSAALAPQSGKTGVFFHGMAGAGKTACAVELAYRHETGRFGGFVWYKAPDHGIDIAGALLNLALEIERQLPGFQMVQVVDRTDEFVSWLPRLTELLERQSILIVLDNLESLLTSDGKWRDERWGHLISALLRHRGLSRVLMTSRVRPADLGDEARVQIEPIHALSLSEAALLARELPNLGRLLRGESGVGLTRGRELVSRSLAVVQGHPKLIELAEGQAAHPEALEARLERASEAWTGGEGRLQAFFRDGETPFHADEFLTALTQWSDDVVASLSPAVRTLFRFLCCLEEGDRQSRPVEIVWPNLWRRLERPDEVPDLKATLEPLVTAGLVDARRVDDDRFAYAVHPGVAESGRTETGDDLQAAVDTELAAFWLSVWSSGLERETQGTTWVLVYSGPRGAPYLLRQKRWLEASRLLHEALLRHPTPRNAAALLPRMRQLVTETKGTPDELNYLGMLSHALKEAGHVSDAEPMIREIMKKAVERGDFRAASVNAEGLIEILRNSGRTEEALTLAKEMTDYTREAALGPWTQLFDEVIRLEILVSLGRHEETSSDVTELIGRMQALPVEGGHNEAVTPWKVRETLLDVGSRTLAGLRRYEEAVLMNEEIVASKESRGAPPVEIARTRANGHGPLLRLGRYQEAGEVLRASRAIFEREQDLQMLSVVFGGLAELERCLNNMDAALVFQKTSLRYSYVLEDAGFCKIGHTNLATRLGLVGAERIQVVAHDLCGAIIELQTAHSSAPAMTNLTRDFAESTPDEPPVPASFDELCDIVEDVEGVRFRALFERLPRRVATGDEALAAVVELAKQRAATTEDEAENQSPEE